MPLQRRLTGRGDADGLTGAPHISSASQTQNTTAGPADPRTTTQLKSLGSFVFSDDCTDARNASAVSRGLQGDSQSSGLHGGSERITCLASLGCVDVNQPVGGATPNHPDIQLHLQPRL
ncbi:hypothetical protein EYF80_041887 [Liparis tanakae]|uniref:Uncharacterized protein n=1 Tax=Liparis tanakae TaxID=230148 RepID=A0A4Z2G583_9TELE|nr:hypothetical protein EYF80_041887 [Liparis tanakae]